MNTNDYLIKKAFNSYLIVAIFTTMSATLGMTIDSLVAGNLLGSDQLAALGVVTPLVSLISAASGVLSGGALALCNVHIGRGRTDQVNPVFTITIAAGIVLALVLSFACFFGNGVVASILGAKGVLIPYVEDYIKVLAFGFVPVIASFLLLMFTRMDGSPRLGLYSILTMSVVNVACDFLFAGPLNMGMFGMALATVLGYVAACLMSFVHFLSKHNTLKLVSLHGFGKNLKRILILGTPNALNRLSSMLSILVLNHLLLAVSGVAAVTALTTQSTLYAILGSVSLGIGQTLTFVEGLFYGEEDRSALKRTLKRALTMGLAISLAVSVITFVFAPKLPAFFGIHEAGTAALTIAAIRFLCVTLLFVLVTNALTNFYQSTQNVKMANMVCVCSNFVFVVLSALALLPLFKVDAVWLAFPLGGLLTIALVVAVASIRRKKLSFGIDAIMLLPKSFGEEIEASLEFSIGNDLSQVPQASDNVYQFCLRYGIDERRAYHVSLSVEEMAGNVIRHGFKLGKEQYLDIRIIKTARGLIYRMRDDGTRFNPLEYAGAPDQDPASGIGIRMVRELAADIQYRYTLAMNNLIIQLI